MRHTRSAGFIAVCSFCCGCWLLTGCGGDDQDSAASGGVAATVGGTSSSAGGSSGGSLSGAGGTSPKPSTSASMAACDTYTSCGGDVVGTWTATDNCAMRLSLEGEDAACAGLLTSMVDDRNAALTFAADGTYAQVLSAGILAMTMTYTPACYAVQEGATLTAELCTAMSATGSSPSDDPLVCSYTRSCAMAGENCVCDWVMPCDSATITGSYTTGNATLTMTDSGGLTQSVSSYCVDGNTLKRGTDADGALVVYEK